jgi:hypothetical protein
MGNSLKKRQEEKYIRQIKKNYEKHGTMTERLKFRFYFNNNDIVPIVVVSHFSSSLSSLRSSHIQSRETYANYDIFALPSLKLIDSDYATFQDDIDILNENFVHFWKTLGILVAMRGECLELNRVTNLCDSEFLNFAGSPYFHPITIPYRKQFLTSKIDKINVFGILSSIIVDYIIE